MIEKLLNFCKNLIKKDTTSPAFGIPRSTLWPKIRGEHITKESFCQACGTTKNLNVHHIIPYHLDKNKELDPENLITLCEEHHCHLIFGHLCSWYSYNPNVREDVIQWLEKVKNRP